MALGWKSKWHLHFWATLLCVMAIWLCPGSFSRVIAQEEEPIASIGHGAFFDHQGNQLEVTQEFVERVQRWYRRLLLADLTDRQRAEFADFERRLTKGLGVTGQERLVVEHRALEWLFNNSPRYRNNDR